MIRAYPLTALRKSRGQTLIGCLWNSPLTNYFAGRIDNWRSLQFLVVLQSLGLLTKKPTVVLMEQHRITRILCWPEGINQQLKRRSYWLHIRLSDKVRASSHEGIPQCFPWDFSCLTQKVSNGATLWIWKTTFVLLKTNCSKKSGTTPIRKFTSVVKVKELKLIYISILTRIFVIQLLTLQVCKIEK